MRLSFLTLAIAWPLLAQNRPGVNWMTILPGDRPDTIEAIRPAADGTVWVAGVTRSNLASNAPNDPFQAALSGPSDLFLARYRPGANGGTTLLYWTFLGGNGDETFGGLEIGTNGFLYLAGTTTSSDFPLAGEAIQTALSGTRDAFVAVIDPNASGAGALAYASYFGGTGLEFGTALALRADGNFALIGTTDSIDLPHGDNVIQGANRGTRDLFLVQLNPFRNPKTYYASYLGGDSTDEATAAAFDATGHLWITGTTASGDFPVTNEPGTQATRSSALDGFLVRLDLSRSGLDGLVFASYLGGSLGDFPSALRLGPDGLLYLTGHTFSSDFITTSNAFQRGLRGELDGFLALIDPAAAPAAMFRYASFFGGAGAEVPYAIEPLADGLVALAGYVVDGGLPTSPSAPQPSPASIHQEGFLAVIDPRLGASGLTLSTYFGGAYQDSIRSLRANPAGDLYFGGSTFSPDLAGTDGSARLHSPGAAAAFAARLVIR